KDFFPIDVTEIRVFSRLILPATLAVGTIKQELLIPPLRHFPGRALNALIRPSLKSEGNRVGLPLDVEDKNFTTGRQAGAISLAASRGLKGIHSLCNLTQCLIRHILPDERTVRLGSKHHLSASTIQKCARRLQPLAQLPRRTLEFQL